MALTPMRFLWTTRLPGLKENIDRVFDDFFGQTGFPTVEGAWIPAADIHETKKNVVVTMDIPSMDPKDVEISIVGDRVTIKGERKQEEELKQENCYVSERVYGSFQRTFQLPTEVNTEGTKAEYKDGVLKITMPKSEKVLPKEIKIEVK